MDHLYQVDQSYRDDGKVGGQSSSLNEGRTDELILGGGRKGYNDDCARCCGHEEHQMHLLRLANTVAVSSLSAKTRTTLATQALAVSGILASS